MQCSACGATSTPEELFCSFCDSDLKAQELSKEKVIRDLEARSLSENEKVVYKSIRDFSRKVRRSRFKFADLERLVDIEEDILVIASAPLSMRFKELVRLVSNDYVEKGSIMLFGETKELFAKYA